MSLCEALLVVAFAVISTCILSYVATLAVWTIELEYAPWPGSVPVFGPHSMTGWSLGSALGIGVCAAFLAGINWLRLQRWIAFAVAAGCLVLLAASVFIRPLDDEGARIPLLRENLVGLSAAAATAILIARRRRLTSPARRRVAIGMLAVTFVSAVALGLPTLAETYEEYRSQELRPFALELVAAHPSSDGVAYDGQTYALDHADRVEISSSHVFRVRLFDAALSIRVDDDTADELRARSIRRRSQLDALYIDGELVSVLHHEDVFVDRLWVADDDHAALTRIFERLTAGP